LIRFEVDGKSVSKCENKITLNKKVFGLKSESILFIEKRFRTKTPKNLHTKKHHVKYWLHQSPHFISLLIEKRVRVQPLFL